MSIPNPDENATDPLGTVLGSLLGTFTVAAFAYLGALGFAGGTVPVLGWHLAGGALHGLLWMAVLASAGLVVLWFIPLLATMALCAALARFRPGAALSAAVRPVRRLLPLKQAA
ncbi:MAG: hypothetical protein ACRDYV_11930 [Acidimicrobiia bacterium]